MDLIDTLSQLSNRLPNIMPSLQTEESTKNALIMPFLMALGYNVFDPTEVIPEYTADVGTKKGEKVDYVIMRDGAPAILIECKSAGTNLGTVHSSQLYRYFTTTTARFGILTNGVIYKFFTDSEKANIMDEKPFFEFSLERIDTKVVEEIKKFSKTQYDEENILSNAADLKYKKQFRLLFNEELESVSEDFVRLFTKRVYDGVLNKDRLKTFTSLVGQAFSEWVNSKVSERLQNALDGLPAGVDISATPSTTPTAAPQQPAIAPAPKDETPDEKGDGIVTTTEEIEGFYIVRSLLCPEIAPERIVMRDAKTYCAILLDDNNRKPICRFVFTERMLRVVFLDKQRNVEQVELTKLTDLYNYAEKIRSYAALYLS